MNSTAIGFTSGAALMLVACSYWDGVTRTLTFDRDVSELSCVTSELTSLGYKVQPTRDGIEYGKEKYTPDGIKVQNDYFQLGVSNAPDQEPNPKILIHSATIPGSGPAYCKDVKPLAEILKSIEAQVFPTCNLTPIKKPKQYISCGPGLLR